MKSTRLTQPAFDLIVRFETGGREYYEQVYRSRPCWPGGSSGVTIGCGYDLGYEGAFSKDWHELLTEPETAALARCIGKTGTRGQQALSGVRNIFVPWETALTVFDGVMLPREIHTTLHAFPAADRVLTANAFGALVSLVFNRGGEIDATDRRLEMRRIRDAIADAAAHPHEPERTPDADDNLHRFLAAQFRAMKRLWHDDPRSDGDLCDRRDAEAALTLTPDA